LELLRWVERHFVFAAREELFETIFPLDPRFAGPNLKISFPFSYTTRSPADIVSGVVGEDPGDFNDTETRLLEMVSGAFSGIAASVLDGIAGCLL
jgi:hypothetical protein